MDGVKRARPGPLRIELPNDLYIITSRENANI
jgi:hypothetical protein